MISCNSTGTEEAKEQEVGAGKREGSQSQAKHKSQGNEHSCCLTAQEPSGSVKLYMYANHDSSL